MNIFIIDEDPERAAIAHCDKHVVKMILESAQMLCTAHRLVNGDEYADRVGLYKAAYVNHPCTVWVREHPGAYAWTWRLMRALCDEFVFRFRREHACMRLLDALNTTPSIVQIGQFRLEDAPQAMPEQYKVPGDPVQAYRNYYLGEKQYFASWTHRKPPEWWAWRTK